jgi:tellurite resistance-related uncharacterized protein
MRKPYRSTPVFDEAGIPAALRRDHSTKAGVWGLIRVLEGRLRVGYETGPELTLGAGEAALVRPRQMHRVGPVGRVLMRVEFYDAEPEGF